MWEDWTVHRRILQKRIRKPIEDCLSTLVYICTMLLKRFPFLTVALIVIPLLSMTTTTPIFLVLDNSVSLLPFIWIMGCVPLSISWLLNYHVFNAVQGRVWLQWFITTAIMTSLVYTLRSTFEVEVLNFMETTNGAPVKQIPPLLTVIGIVKLNNTLIIVFQTLVRYRLNEVQLAKALNDAKIAQIEAQYENLKNQIHPHFLFNTLNILKTLVHKDPEKVEQYILKVSSFLRASLKSSDAALISVEEDLNIALNYLEIQELRFKDAFRIHVDLSEEYLKQQIPVLTFQCLIENILKHNTLSKNQPVLIDITGSEKRVITVSNTLFPRVAADGFSTSTGLKNLMKRFVLLGMEEPVIHKTEKTFGVNFNTLSP